MVRSASCQPRSGSRFQARSHQVRYSATDSSGNVAEAAFTITVRPAASPNYWSET